MRIVPRVKARITFYVFVTRINGRAAQVLGNTPLGGTISQGIRRGEVRVFGGIKVGCTQLARGGPVLGATLGRCALYCTLEGDVVIVCQGLRQVTTASPVSEVIAATYFNGNTCMTSLGYIKVQLDGGYLTSVLDDASVYFLYSMQFPIDYQEGRTTCVGSVIEAYCYIRGVLVIYGVTPGCSS